MDSDEQLYEAAAKELASSPRTGLLAKCMAKCGGDEYKAKAMYIELRVEMLKENLGVKKKPHGHKGCFIWSLRIVLLLVMVGAITAYLINKSDKERRERDQQAQKELEKEKKREEWLQVLVSEKLLGDKGEVQFGRVEDRVSKCIQCKGTGHWKGVLSTPLTAINCLDCGGTGNADENIRSISTRITNNSKFTLKQFWFKYSLTDKFDNRVFYETSFSYYLVIPAKQTRFMKSELRIPQVSFEGISDYDVNLFCFHIKVDDPPQGRELSEVDKSFLREQGVEPLKNIPLH